MLLWYVGTGEDGFASLAGSGGIGGCHPQRHRIASVRGRVASDTPKSESKGYTSAEFQAVRKALLSCLDADRAYLRRWVMQWIDDRGRIIPNAEPLPDRGC